MLLPKQKQLPKPRLKPPQRRLAKLKTFKK